MSPNSVVFNSKFFLHSQGRELLSVIDTDTLGEPHIYLPAPGLHLHQIFSLHAKKVVQESWQITHYDVS